MNIISFIPARSGSKSIKDKNIKELGGKSLIVWSIEKSLDCGLRTILNTDNEKYAEIAQKYGAEIMIRPKELAQDKTSMYELLRNEIFRIKPIPDLVLLLQPTSPFRKKIHIKLAIEMMKNGYDSIISVEKVPEKYNPTQIIVKGPQGFKMADGLSISQRITQRQKFSESYLPTGSIYLFKTENLKNGSIYGENVGLLETESEININSQKDWEEAELWIKNKHI